MAICHQRSDSWSRYRGVDNLTLRKIYGMQRFGAHVCFWFYICKHLNPMFVRFSFWWCCTSFMPSCVSRARCTCLVFVFVEISTFRSRTVLLHPLCQISLVCQLPCKQTASPKQKANGKQSNRRLVPYSQIGTWVCSRLGGHIINCFLSQICCKSGPFAFYRRWPPINGYFSAWKIGKINQIK